MLLKYLSAKKTAFLFEILKKPIYLHPQKR